MKSLHQSPSCPESEVYVLHSNNIWRVQTFFLPLLLADSIFLKPSSKHEECHQVHVVSKVHAICKQSGWTVVIFWQIFCRHSGAMNSDNRRKFVERTVPIYNNYFKNLCWFTEEIPSACLQWPCNTYPMHSLMLGTSSLLWRRCGCIMTCAARP